MSEVTICHIPPGNPGNAHTISVGASAISAHIKNHGDVEGPCNSEEGGATSGRVGGAGGERVATAWNNEHKTFDGGYGITQITSPSFKGYASRLWLKSETCKEFRQVKYGGVYVPEYLCDFYTNTTQSVYANVKDGLSVLADKYDYYGDAIDGESANKVWATGDGVTIRNDDMKNLLALRGYNGFGPGCTKFYFGSEEELDEDDAKRLLGYEKYLTRVSAKLLTLGDTYNHLDVQNHDSNSNLYKKINLTYKNKKEICVQSPVYLEIVNEEGKVTGGPVNSVVHQIPEVVYDTESSEAASIIFPQGEYIYRITGTANDEYGLVIDSFVDDNEPVEFVAIAIPIRTCSVHEYKFDWEVVSNDGDGVLVKVDQDCDGIFEHAFMADSELTQDEYITATSKIVICHIPPGNPSNPHTISIGKPAWKAHQKHGDYEGPCDGRDMEDSVKVKNKAKKTLPGQLKNQGKSGKIPPGQAKKIKKKDNEK